MRCIIGWRLEQGALGVGAGFLQNLGISGDF
jgi:hypothetical protein